MTSEPKKLGRPRKDADLRVISVTMTPAELARLDAMPGRSRREKIVGLMAYFEAHDPEARRLAEWNTEPPNPQALIERIVRQHEQSK